MPSPDQFDDFSHLPTIDEGQEEARQRKEALWTKHRRQAQSQEEPSPNEVPAGPDSTADFVSGSEQEPEPEHESGVSQFPESREPALQSQPPAAHSEEWRALFDLELEDPRLSSTSYEDPPQIPEEQPAPKIRVNKTIVRPQTRVASPESEQPAPVREASRETVTPEEKKSHPLVTKEPQQQKKPQDAGPKKETESREAAKDSTSTQAKAESASANGTASGGAKNDTSARAKASPAPSAEAESAEAAAADAAEPAAKSAWQQRWEKVGGMALALSIGAHVLLLSVAAYLVVSRTSGEAVDFLPGGGTAQSQSASEALEHHIQRKKSPWLKKSAPMTRIAAMNKISDITLPDTQPDLLEMPKATMLAPSSLSAGMGLAGAGGGMGSGIGIGGRNGVVFQPFSLFGHAIKAKRLAVVLDISTSMMEHLPRVVAEVDRAARGSVVVCYFGCGLEPPPGGRKLEGDEVFRTSDVAFEKFWRQGGATLEQTRSYKINPKDPIPSEDVYRLLSRRPQTFFIHSLGLGYTWTALLSNEVRNADAIYWFSDFEDHVDFKQVGIVEENLKNRRQKLYIHPYEHGSSFDLVRSQLVETTGGDVIEEPAR